MANTAAYMAGRQKYQRPQAMLWANNPGTLVLSDPEDAESSSIYVPAGYEIGAKTSTVTNIDTTLVDDFIILSDDNREALKFDIERLEQKERMINGRMRSYHVADKLTLSTAWNTLPSRSYASLPDFNVGTGKSPSYNSNTAEFTTDGGAGGAEILNWYETHKGSFWVFLSYDKHTNFGNDADAKNHLPEYSQVLEMFISSFDYSVNKRGQNFDFWDISVTLEEV
jgi:hypothetical protein